MESIRKLTEYFKSQVGYLEKQSNASLEDFTANAGDRNYTKYGAYFGHNGPDAYWCDYFVDYCLCQVFGRELAGKLLGGLSGYTPTSAGYFKKMGRWHTDKPQEGDIAFFQGTSRINHTGYVYKVNKATVYTVEGNTSSASGVVRNGGAVACKEYPITSTRIAGYGRPDYSLAESQAVYVKGWQRAADGVRWWYQYEDGDYAANRWHIINHHYYLFDRNGYMCTGWHRWDGHTCDPDEGGGDWYFLDNTLDGPLEGACWHSRENGAQEIWYIDMETDV